MGIWEPSIGGSDEWYTPAYIFRALGERFDLDVASPPRETYVPADRRISADSLSAEWSGFVWMNPPFGARNGMVPWLDKFFQHGHGIALTADRTSAPWWQAAAKRADAILFLSPKVKFEKPDGSLGKAPGGGTTLMAAGDRALQALKRARSLGYLAKEF